MKARSLLSLLFHADKALDLVRTAHDLGLIARLDGGPVTLGELVTMTGARPLRLYKFLDGLESLGLIVRDQPTDGLLTAQYVSREPPLSAAVAAVLGAHSNETDRDAYPWREVHGRLGDVLRGRLDASFAWPPRDHHEVRAFEASMAAGSLTIVEVLQKAHPVLFDTASRRWVDVGGGDGAIAEALLREDDSLVCDVFNLPAVAPLVQARAAHAGLEGRLGFVAGDFLREPLPTDYNVLSFIRVLHDWPEDVARELLHKARYALAPGARVVVCEEFRTSDRLAVQFFWTYFLIGADTCRSRLREVEWYTEALVALGFTDVRVIHGEPDIVTAIRA